ncbi:AraC family transcriptional regulator [Yinghuangia soli]|uniref:AraC family transcriptional regulator n=1 Tax=Yinghuangia soli TaxID=2908204 RepID=A0AA41Q0T5_9ACTN|nr:AraC family transcriptional regulator [Yinghuangia soli]MCF2528875.1 AraC family transcriptional regulator [Yinghuangia soli]
MQSGGVPRNDLTDNLHDDLPDNLHDDLLSDLLAPLRLRGVFHSRWSARAPWGVAGEREDCAILHYVQDGECTVELPGSLGSPGIPGSPSGPSGPDNPYNPDAIVLRAGNLAVFPHGTPHRLADRPGRATIPLAAVLPSRPPGGSGIVEIPGPGPATTFLCGGLHYDGSAAAPLYRALPPVIVLDAALLATEPLLADALRSLDAGWAPGEPGAGLIALRVFELAYVLALRVALREPDAAAQTGTAAGSPTGLGLPVLQALRHPALAKALLAVHNRFAEPWTLETLAAEAGMSRSAFAAGFRELVGEPPIRHLTARRMQEATRLLTETTLSNARIAERVGYRSDVGFHLAFRNWTGRTPGDYRRDRTGTASGRPTENHVTASG